MPDMGGPIGRTCAAEDIGDLEARVWLDRRAFTPATAHAFTIDGVTPGDHVIVVELGPVAAPTAYRASLVTVARVATSMQAAAPLR